MARVVVIGDVGGHPDQLRRALAGVGATGARLPADVTVVQVGDLVDRGPDSSGVLDLVRSYVEAWPRQWVQLAGNHEAQYLPGGTSFWPARLPEGDAELLRAWWRAGVLQVAAAVRDSEGNDLLVTHAGLTVPAWRELGAPVTATTAADLLNLRPEPLIWDGFHTGTYSGPLWAEAGSELYEPWMEHHAGGGVVPFGQVHGHSSVVGFSHDMWHCSGRVRQRTSVDRDARHTRVRIGGRTFTGVDPKHGRTGAPAWRPLVLDGAEVLAGGVPL